MTLLRSDRGVGHPRLTVTTFFMRDINFHILRSNRELALLECFMYYCAILLRDYLPIIKLAFSDVMNLNVLANKRWSFEIKWCRFQLEVSIILLADARLRFDSFHQRCRVSFHVTFP